MIFITVYDLILQILSSCASIALPFGFTFGALIVFIWSLPLLLRFIKSIF